MNVKKIICFVFVAAVVSGCAPVQKDERLSLVGLGHTFRDLRQHTFSSTDKVSYSSVDVSPDASKLLVVQEKAGNKDIYLKSINGKALTQKTFHKADDTSPVFSPDGSKIAFASKRSGNWDIFIMNTHKGRAKRQITSSSEAEIAPSWSPDGKKLAYCRLSSVSGEWEIWTYNLENSAITNLVPGKFPEYSPTENLMTFQRVANSGDQEKWYALWVINDEGYDETIIMSSQEEGYVTPAWSKDGTKIVFATGGKSQKAKLLFQETKQSYEVIVGKKANDIWTVNMDGTRPTQLTAHDAQDWSPVWGDDGRIYFVSQRDKYNNIWSVIPEFID